MEPVDTKKKPVSVNGAVRDVRVITDLPNVSASPVNDRQNDGDDRDNVKPGSVVVDAGIVVAELIDADAQTGQVTAGANNVPAPRTAPPVPAPVSKFAHAVGTAAGLIALAFRFWKAIDSNSTGGTGFGLGMGRGRGQGRRLGRFRRKYNKQNNVKKQCRGDRK